jgi:hypothetical protein
MINRLSSVLLTIWLASLTAWASGPIHLKTRNLTAADYPAAEALGPVAQGPGHLLVQFTGTPQASDVRELERRGARVVGAAPDGGLTISVDQPISLEGLAVKWAGLLLPEDKISPLISAAADTGPSVVVIEFHPDVATRRALELLRASNVQILKHPDLAPNHQLVSASSAALAQIAGYDEVAYIFPASNDLIQGNPVMACTSAMMGQAAVGQYVTVGTGWGGADANGIVELDYVFTQMSAKLPAASTQSEIIRALQEWTKYTNISFVPGGTSTVDRTVAIMFAEGVHGDGFPFTAGSPVLAHTFFPSPPNLDPIAGQMHLNEDQDWHIGSDVDVYTVALHEAGHALGLGHSDDPTAVMYPYYRFGAVLSPSDIASIQSLYGSPNTVSAPALLSVAISNPATATVTTAAASIALSGTAAGGTGALQVIWANGQGATGTAAGSASWSIGSVPLSPGSNVITVQVTDSTGNTASSSITVTQQVSTVTPPSLPAVPITPIIPSLPITPIIPTAPTTPTTPTTPTPSGPPSLTITSPSMTIVATSLPSITMSGTATANVTSVTWTNSTGSSGTATGTTSWTAAAIPLLEGTNMITVNAFDAAGASAWRSVTVVSQ